MLIYFIQNVFSCPIYIFCPIYILFINVHCLHLDNCVHNLLNEHFENILFFDKTNQFIFPVSLFSSHCIMLTSYLSKTIHAFTSQHYNLTLKLTRMKCKKKKPKKKTLLYKYMNVNLFTLINQWPKILLYKYISYIPNTLKDWTLKLTFFIKIQCTIITQ